MVAVLTFGQMEELIRACGIVDESTDSEYFYFLKVNNIAVNIMTIKKMDTASLNGDPGRNFLVIGNKESSMV